jgi:cell division protease FtsH
MGGRAAEDLVFGRFTTGAANDLKQATDLARRMICSYGMSEKIGPVSFADDEHDVFLGRDFVQRRDYSQKKAQEIDEEVSSLLREQYDSAKQLLHEYRQTLDRISLALLERETLDTEELARLLAGEPLPPLPPIAGAKTKNDPPPERAKPKPAGGFPADVPDPEPVPG